MEPIRLWLEDFCGYSSCEIDFTKFSIAVIIGKINGNDKLSNGAGKSTIFHAIKYVLFNEVDFSTIDKVIRYDCEICRVGLEFIASDQNIYRIIRSRSKKTGSDVRLFRKNADTWDDLTQRRASDTEKELEKIIKINYKTFCNSVLFSQFDFSGLASLTPERRKQALKDALQLNIYSKFEALSKKKSVDIGTNIKKNKILIDNLGDPAKDIEIIKAQTTKMEGNINYYKQHLTIFENEATILNNDYLSFMAQRDTLNKNAVSFTESKLKLQKNISDLENNIGTYNHKISQFKQQELNLLNEVEVNNKQMTIYAQEVAELPSISKELLLVSQKLSSQRVVLATEQVEVKKLSIPFPDGDICNSCRQLLTPEHKQNCQNQIDHEIKELHNKIGNLNRNIDILSQQEKQLLAKSLNLKEKKNKIDFILEKNKLKKKDIEQQSSLLVEYVSLLHNDTENLRNKNIELSKINDDLIHPDDLTSKLDQKIAGIYSELEGKKKKINHLSGLLQEATNQLAVLHHTNKMKQKDLDSLLDMKKDLVSMEDDLLIFQRVSQAFGSTGIPTFIIHTILDDLQAESNSMIGKLRPGLQLQFVVLKDRNGSQEDTLDIKYFINSKEMEYNQLSGAQKLIVILCLKLGLSNILKKRLGADIKMLLIDEADQCLDMATVEVFEETMKKLQYEYKILIITHNNELKERFSHFILVEQDDNYVSTAQVLNSW